MGAGALGLSIAYECARRGAAVRVIDTVGVGAGASGGIVGALAPHTPDRWDSKKAFQFESLIMAQSFWDGVSATSRMDTGYGRVGRVQPILNERGIALAHERAAEAETLWQGRAQWNVVPAGDFAGWAPHSPTGYLIHDTLSARMHPRLATMALAKAVTNLGGVIDVDPKGIAPDTGRVIWATGVAGLADLGTHFKRDMGSGEKGQSMLLGYDATDRPQLFADWIHLVPHANGTVAIGSTTERYFDSATDTDQQLDDLYRRAMESFPMLVDAPIIERWAGLRPRSFSRAPILGAWPGRDGHFVANGGFKIGFGMAPKIATTMTDLVLEGQHSIPDRFDLSVQLAD